MLTEEQIQANRITFLKHIADIDIPDADTQGLVDFLDSNDFFTAPASTQYHCNYRGGLCYHSLNVFDNLVELANHYFPGRYDMNTLLVVGLLHDVSKTNFYELYARNVKNDEGKWEQKFEYRVRDSHQRFLAGTHEENSMLILSEFIPMKREEIVAVMNHHLHTNDGNQFLDQSAVLNKYPLLTLLHLADMISTFLIERDVDE